METKYNLILSIYEYSHNSMYNMNESIYDTFNTYEEAYDKIVELQEKHKDKFIYKPRTKQDILELSIEEIK